MDAIDELRRLAGEIELRRTQLSLSKNELCNKFGQLGSTKTFGRLLNPLDDLDGMDLAKQLSNYRAAIELLNGYTEDPEENKIYGDFQFMRDAVAAVSEALQQTDNTRVVLVTSAPGGGKSTLRDFIKEDPRFKNIFYGVEATEAWRLKVNGLLRALLFEIGLFDRSASEDGEKRKAADPAKALPVGGDAMLSKLIERINGRKLILAIDESHHLGPEGLNVVKSIINQTRAVVVLFAHPQLINRVTRSAYAETSQLWHNRLYEHVQLPSPASADVLEFLERRGIKFASAKDASAIAAAASEGAKVYGLWKYVKRCAREARKLGDKKITQADFAGVIGKVKSKISLGG